MKVAVLAVAFMLTAMVGFVPTDAYAESGVNGGLNCDVGPVQKTYGKTDWLVYSCHDDVTVVFSAVADSPAAPFYFIFSPVKGRYKLYGEGTGNKAYTDAAMAELSKLKPQDAQALIKETEAVH